MEEEEKKSFIVRVLEIVKKPISIMTASLIGVGSVLAVYTPNYTASDMAPITIDFVGFLGVSLVDFAQIIGLILAFGVAFAVARWGLRG